MLLLLCMLQIFFPHRIGCTNKFMIWQSPSFTTWSASSNSVLQSPSASRHPEISPLSKPAWYWWELRVYHQLTKYHQTSSTHYKPFSKMGSSISKYEDLELSTAEGGLEPLPTSKKSKQFCRNCNNKTQCQLCKRLVGPINPFSWSGKEFHL